MVILVGNSSYYYPLVVHQIEDMWQITVYLLPVSSQHDNMMRVFSLLIMLDHQGMPTLPMLYPLEIWYDHDEDNGQITQVRHVATHCYQCPPFD